MFADRGGMHKVSKRGAPRHPPPEACKRANKPCKCCWPVRVSRNCKRKGERGSQTAWHGAPKAADGLCDLHKIETSTNRKDQAAMSRWSSSSFVAAAVFLAIACDAKANPKRGFVADHAASCDDPLLLSNSGWWVTGLVCSFF